MSDLPLANLTSATALLFQDYLIIRVDSLVYGAGGDIELRWLEGHDIPHTLEIRELPGNGGINWQDPVRMLCTRAIAFRTDFPPSIVQFLHRDGKSIVSAAQVSTVDGSANGIAGTPWAGVAALGGARTASAEEDEGGHGWSAIHNRMPPGPPSLYVSRWILAPTPGYRYELRRVEPQGFNSSILLLELLTIAPATPEPEGLTWTPVEPYREITGAPYTDVTINPEGKTIPVKEVF
ncbi:MAG TPA: hypothetical protein VM493_11105 [Vicinamibacterales bacterium]|jgi:hypothetical protein|nr:hypothetical protein [Vicinamibacterales bacterium]